MGVNGASRKSPPELRKIVELPNNVLIEKVRRHIILEIVNRREKIAVVHLPSDDIVSCHHGLRRKGVLTRPLKLDRQYFSKSF